MLNFSNNNLGQYFFKLKIVYSIFLNFFFDRNIEERKKFPTVFLFFLNSLILL